MRLPAAAILCTAAALGRVEAAYRGNATRVCRVGPPLAPVEGVANCLVIGDSVSIGYTPYVATILNGTCQVQHAPYSGDGGALDTVYQQSCLDVLLRGAEQQEYTYDAIVFNSGLHDTCYSASPSSPEGNYPEECVDADTYAANVRRMFATLTAAGGIAGPGRVGWISTTPVPFNVTSDAKVLSYNKLAATAAAGVSPAVPVTDLHALVVGHCGQPPYNTGAPGVANCTWSDSAPGRRSPHYTGEGYTALGHAVADAFQAILREKGRREPRAAPAPPSDAVTCAAGEGTSPTACPAGSTCTKNNWSYTGAGCCLLSDAVDCGDNWHCCPAGTTCVNCGASGCDCSSA